MTADIIDVPQSVTGTSAGATRARDDRVAWGPDETRIRYGAWLIAAAFLLLGVVFGIGVSKMTGGPDMVAALGSVTTVVGTIIGTFFGVQIGSHGKEAAEAGRTHAEAAARLALGKLDPRAADDVNQKLCEARAGSPHRRGRR
jgi:hypothetical protein